MKMLSKFFRDKSGNTVIYILLAVGILFVVGGSSLSAVKKTSTEEVKEPMPAVKSIDEQLSEILSEIKGAGEVSVMIVKDNDGSKNYGYDTDGKQKKTVILNKQGGEEALVSEEIAPRIRGVLIVADGGGKGSVKEALIKSTQTVLGIAPHKIVVCERKE